MASKYVLNNCHIFLVESLRYDLNCLNSSYFTFGKNHKFNFPYKFHIQIVSLGCNTCVVLYLLPTGAQ
jgi:hypothetical protein